MQVWLLVWYFSQAINTVLVFTTALHSDSQIILLAIKSVFHAAINRVHFGNTLPAHRRVPMPRKGEAPLWGDQHPWISYLALNLDVLEA